MKSDTAGSLINVVKKKKQFFAHELSGVMTYSPHPRRLWAVPGDPPQECVAWGYRLRGAVHRALCATPPPHCYGKLQPPGRRTQLAPVTQVGKLWRNSRSAFGTHLLDTRICRPVVDICVVFRNQHLIESPNKIIGDYTLLSLSLSLSLSHTHTHTHTQSLARKLKNAASYSFDSRVWQSNHHKIAHMHVRWTMVLFTNQEYSWTKKRQPGTREIGGSHSGDD